ncbi:hypothetical protein [Novosphingobium rosa]|uniref:hypothetical protein n=1 Tax=Novosphingobium rosa TaxID=76978 RepID=UPI000830EB3C|nr:hypothetical protein [Novosphingobium rosa]
MRVQVVPFIPDFIVGLIFLFLPGLAVTFFARSEPAGAAVVFLTGLAALIRPQAHWALYFVLCTLRTVPFLMAAIIAVAMRTGVAPGAWLQLGAFIAFGALANWRLHRLRADGLID